MNEKIKILLAEDSPDDVRLTIEALKDAGVPNELYTTEDGQEAVEFLFKQGKYSVAPTPDLVLLDLNLPKKTGHDVLKEMQAIPKFHEIPVVLLTVSQSEDDIARALETGMSYYMRKPVEAERLSSVLLAISSDSKYGEVNNAVFRVIAGNPQTPQHILTNLAHHCSDVVRKRVAENPKITPALLAEMSHDKSPEVRLSVANNPAASKAILSELSNDDSADVRFGMAELSSIPREILEKLSQDENPYVAAAAKATIEQLQTK
jgi:CheY-like chemotaxis protein